MKPSCCFVASSLSLVSFHGRQNDRPTNQGTGNLKMIKSSSAEWINLLSPDMKVPLPGRISPPRSGSVSVSSGDGTNLFAFGGYAEVASSSSNAPPHRYVVNDLWTFAPHVESSPNSWGWTQVDQKQTMYIPGPRLATSWAVFPSQNHPLAVLIGGWDPQEPGTGGIILDDVAMFDVDALRWFQPTSAETNGDLITIPGGPTSRHVAVPIRIRSPEMEAQEAILLHNHRCEDHVLLLFKINDKQAQWSRQPTTGDAPSSRGLHCGTQLNDPNSSHTNSFVLFGGAAKDGMMSNEAFVLDLNTWVWKKLRCYGDLPSPRAGACLCQLDVDSVVLFGGAELGDAGLTGLNDVHILRIDRDKGTGTWECLIDNQIVDEEMLGTTCPPGRNAATLTRINAQILLPNEMLGQRSSVQGDDAYFLLQGGWNPFRKTFSDIFVLRVTSSHQRSLS